MRIEPEKRLIKYDVDPDVLNISKAVTIESGALTITSGALTMTSGGQTLTVGDMTLTAGDYLNTLGNLVLTSGNATLTSGNLTLTSGNAAITGNVTGTGDISRVGDLTLTGSTGVSIAPVSADTGVEMKVICKQVLHTIAGGGITETLTSAIPANSYVFGVQSKIKTTITMTTGVSFLIGVTGDTNRFGDHTALTQNDLQTPGDHEVEAHGLGRYYNTATNILLTGNAGTFDAVGLISVVIYYVDLSPPDNFS